ncbi:MAG: hypothetical protein WAU31_05025 [Candidatus Moraniibacteriota bacterium]
MGKTDEDPRDEDESLKEEIKSLIRQYRKKDRSESDCKIIGELLAIYANTNIGKKQREKVVGWLINRMLKKKTKTIVWEKLYVFLRSKVETLNEKKPREIYFRHKERGRREKNFSAKKKAGESSEETTVIEVATQKNAPKQKRSRRCFILYQNAWHSRRVATN